MEATFDTSAICVEFHHRPRLLTERKPTVSNDSALLRSLQKVASITWLIVGLSLPSMAQTNAATDANAKLAIDQVQIAEAAFRAGDEKSAMQKLDEALKLDPRSTSAMLWKADLFGRLKDYQQAADWTQMALNIDPKNESALSMSCWNLVLLKRLDDAEQNCTRELEINPFSYSANVNLGHIFLIRGHEERAFAHYRSGLWHIEKESDLLDGPILDFSVLREVYGRRAEFAPAEQWFRLHGPRWIARDAPASVSAEHFAQAVERQSDKVSHWVNLCWYRLLARQPDAATACTSARELDRMDVPAQLTSAYVAWHAGDRVAASRWIQAASMLSESRQALLGRFDLDIAVLRQSLNTSNTDLLASWMNDAIDGYLGNRTAAQTKLLDAAAAQAKDLKRRGFSKPGNRREGEFHYGALARYFRSLGAQAEVDALRDLLIKAPKGMTEYRRAMLFKRDVFTCPPSLSLDEAEKIWKDQIAAPDASEWQQIGECMARHLLPDYSSKVPAAIQDSYPDLIALALTCKDCKFSNLSPEKVKQLRRQVLRSNAANRLLSIGALDMILDVSSSSERWYLDNLHGWLSPNDLSNQLETSPNIRSHIRLFLQAAHDVYGGAYRIALQKLESAIEMLDFGPDRFRDSVDADEALYRFSYHLAAASTALAAENFDSASKHLRAGSLRPLAELRKVLPRQEADMQRAAASAISAMLEIGKTGWFVVNESSMRMADEFIGNAQMPVMLSEPLALALRIRVEAARRFVKSSANSLDWVAESESQVSDALDRAQLGPLSPTLVVNRGCDESRSGNVAAIRNTVTVCSDGGLAVRRFKIASETSELFVTGKFLVESGSSKLVADDDGLVTARSVLGTNWFDLRTGLRNAKDIADKSSGSSLPEARSIRRIERRDRPNNDRATVDQSSMIDGVFTRHIANHIIYQELVGDYRAGRRLVSDACGTGKPRPRSTFASGRIVRCESWFALFDAQRLEYVPLPYASTTIEALQRAQTILITSNILWSVDAEGGQIVALDRPSGVIRAVMPIGRKLGKASIAVTAGNHLALADDYSVMLFTADGRSMKPYYNYSGRPLGVAVDEASGLAAAWFATGGGFVWSITDGSPRWAMHSVGPMKFDGEFLLSVSQGVLRTFKARTGEEVFSFGISSFDVHSILGTMDRLMLLSDDSLAIWSLDTASGASKSVLSYSNFDGGEWTVSDPEGRFDTADLESMPHLHWVMPDDPFTPVPLEAFMKDYYEPRLLARILAGETFKPVRALTSLNRTQPEVKITSVVPEGSDPSLVRVTVSASGATKSYLQGEGASSKELPRPTAVHDLRLFRDGQVVGYADGKLAEFKGAAFTRTFTVRLPKDKSGQEVVFSAYAFNDDRVKSETVRSTFKAPALPSAVAALKGTAYVITMGVNQHDNPAWNLSFAANDARAVRERLAADLLKSGAYQSVVPVSLLSDGVARQASKAALRGVLARLAGKVLDGEASAALSGVAGVDRLKAATPDDLILISFAGHGFADGSGNFYLIPQDTGAGLGKAVTPALQARSISSEELSVWLRDVDAGDMTMIVDACQSAASVQGAGFKPGPMGSRGLGQLSFDKGMRILAASQSDESALEDGKLQQGLLSFSLVTDGLQAFNADREPKDGKIMLDEWLRYGVYRVPGLAEEIKSGKTITVGQVQARATVPVNAAGKVVNNPTQQPALFDFAKKRRVVELARSGQ